MGNAEDRGWGNPWASGYREANIVSVRVPHYGHVGHEQGVVLPVNQRVAPLFVGFLTEAQQRGYVLDDVADDWGYARRCIRGTGPGTNRPCVTSNHAWGLAIDVNATRNPMGAPLRTDIPGWMADLAVKYGLVWGGDWATPDPMHFEFVGSPGDADAYVAHLAKPQGVLVSAGEPMEVDVPITPYKVEMPLDDEGRGNVNVPFHIDRIIGFLPHSGVRPNVDGRYDTPVNTVTFTPDGEETVVVCQGGDPRGRGHLWLRVVP
jgi:hypothetical protein